MTHWNNYEEKRDNIGNNDELIINENGRVKRVKATHFVGKRGLQWPKWDKWEKGDRGERGLPWQKGDTWARGEKGERWDRGASGPRGYQWPKWDKGDRGHRWPIGPQGPAGPGSWDMLNSENLSQLEDKAEARRNLWIEADFTNTLLAKLNSLDGESYAKLSGENIFGWNQTINFHQWSIKLANTNHYKGNYIESKSHTYTRDNKPFNIRWTTFNMWWNLTRELYCYPNEDWRDLGCYQIEKIYYNKDKNTFERHLKYQTRFYDNIAMQSHQIYLRNYGDNSHGIKWNSWLNGPEMWGYYGASLGDTNNHQIIKAYKEKAFLWCWWQAQAIIRSRSSTSATKQMFNNGDVGENDIVVWVYQWRLEFFTKYQWVVRRYNIETNGTVNSTVV